MTDKNNSKDQVIQELYQTYKKELVGFIVGKYSLDHSQAEDIVQIVFIRFAELDSIDEVENPRAFLYKMCGNTAIDKLRREKVQSKYFDASSVYEEPYTEIGPEEEIDSRQRLGIITRAMWAMPSKRRELLAMKGIDGLSYAEIARKVGLSETVVRKHISKALADCHKALGSAGTKQ